jgi:putative ABC transport system permease protein
MFNNYLKITLRNILKFKGYSIINILGLAIGIVACVLIMLYVQDELSFDAYHKDSNRIFRIATEVKEARGEFIAATSPVSMADVIKNDCTEIEYAGSFSSEWNVVIRLDNGELFYEPDKCFKATPDIFSIFDIPFIYGNFQKALSDVNSVMISEEMAKKYFGEKMVVGRRLFFHEKDWIISGVFKNIPANSHLPNFGIITFKDRLNIVPNLSREPINAYSYIKLKDKAELKSINLSINKTAESYINPSSENKQSSLHFFLQNLKDIHLNSHLEREIKTPGNKKEILIFSSIAFLILCIACLNFVNLTTSQSAKRAKEVGIRKVTGAVKSQLVKQFLGESILISFIAFLLALLLAELILPWFNDFTQKQLQLNLLSNTILLYGFIGILLFVSLFAGSYPAFFLSSFQPVYVLKDSQMKGSGSYSSSIRKYLVIFQFLISAVLIIGTLTIFKQLHFMKHTDLGFNMEQMLYIKTQNQEMAKTFRSDFETIKNEFLSHHSVVSVTSQISPPGRMGGVENISLFDGEKPLTKLVNWQFVDANYFDTYQIPFVAGRNFQKNRAADSYGAFVVNEETAKQLGWQNPNQAIGKRLKFWMWEGEIVGVIKNFHYHSLHQKIGPLLYFYMNDFFPESICIKLKSENIQESLSFLNKKWKQIFPNNPFEYQFLHSDFNRLYVDDERTSKLISIFSGLAIFIASMGLFGLSLFTVEQRTKEIGIRKILGAPITGMLGLLTKDFVKLILVSNLFACPIAYFIMNKWLQNFAYRIALDWQIFIFTGALSLMIAFVTLSVQTLRAALANPVESLRYE